MLVEAQRGRALVKPPFAKVPDTDFMSRANPESIFQSGRKAIRNGLIASGVSPELAEEWCDTWEVEAARRGVPRDRDYWLTGALWITERRRARKGIG